jgi:hypothetical protein
MSGDEATREVLGAVKAAVPDIHMHTPVQHIVSAARSRRRRRGSHQAGRVRGRSRRRPGPGPVRTRFRAEHPRGPAIRRETSRMDGAHRRRRRRHRHLAPASERGCPAACARRTRGSRDRVAHHPTEHKPLRPPSRRCGPSTDPRHMSASRVRQVQRPADHMTGGSR